MYSSTLLEVETLGLSRLAPGTGVGTRGVWADRLRDGGETGRDVWFRLVSCSGVPLPLFRDGRGRVTVPYGESLREQTLHDGEYIGVRKILET